ncbi:hypothetical protein GCM10009827_063450 [Dactylosporangium maewongense]|uniref:Uncharacterized protein n=1 Tax=Dactylosporangium maewongense TaxID=634393 RepID=A0ABN2BBD5_9ACTN
MQPQGVAVVGLIIDAALREVTPAATEAAALSGRERETFVRTTKPEV